MHSIVHRAVGAALLGAVGVRSHGHVSNIVINGQSYEGYDPTTFPYKQNPHRNRLGYEANRQRLHRTVQFRLVGYHLPQSATPAGATLPSRRATRSSLLGTPGRSRITARCWLVEIPKSIRAGDYVLRHEIIALHTAGQTNGAQAYPQCINLRITGGGDERPAGVRGTKLYSSGDPGIKFDLYRSFSSYDIPGPDLIDGAEPVRQSSPAASATATATVGSGLGAAPTSEAGGRNNGGGSSTDSDDSTGNGGSRLFGSGQAK
ncbi:unnamed protein product [Parascedosporium putredinis]|uniref:lytic cellulose monooxygenase (C4-dehydrogenating) n=1 Tax=Parascedosporium putredinis TaxID=1442378 RepID=A0A9P1HAX1_9PEZI|nr:unnamed protein product [Parascedosporium putredinis]CAI8002525.1 unnamed protein product [Parascedosporium putredinis]